MTTKTRALGFRDHFFREWRHQSWRAPIVMAIVGLACVLFTHLILPRFPARVLDFMQRGFLLQDLGAVLLLNDLMGVYFPTFFVGLSTSLGVVLMARDEHRLEILLAKPIRASDFVAARAMPVLLSTAAVGVFISAACAAAVALHADVGPGVSPLGALGSGLALTALAVVLIAALQIPFVRLRDPFQGLLIACALWFSTSLPTAVLLYRPDVYVGRQALERAIVVPSLVWHDKTSAWLGPLLFVLALPLGLALVRMAGWVLERSDAA